MRRAAGMAPLPQWAGRWRMAALLVLLALAACKTSVDLHSGLSDAEANEVVAVLRDDGIAAHKRAGKEGVAVSIPEDSLARATAVLGARGLPHRRSARMGDVFKKEGLISSPLEERARYVFALSQELEATLAQIDGVVVARVHVVLPEKAGAGEPMQPPSAAVFVKHRASLEPDAIGFRIRQLVARSIPGMGPQALDRVSVVFVEGVPVPDAVVALGRGQPGAVVAALVLAMVLGLGAVGFLLRKMPWVSALLARPKTAAAGRT